MQLVLKPEAVVIVATIRALKMHGGVAKRSIKEENVDALAKGMENLQKHVETIQSFGVPFVLQLINSLQIQMQKLHTYKSGVMSVAMQYP